MAPALLVLAAAAAWALTGLARQYALRRALIDVPNDRSSHSDPTPRGGGMSIAVVCLTGFGVLGIAGSIPAAAAAALVVGGVLIAFIGWLDDHRDVHPLWRLLAQFVAAGSAVYLVGGLDSLAVGSWTLPLGLAGSLLAVVGLVWLINLFNFMDGVDGIAGGEAVMVAGAGGLLLLASGALGFGLASLLVAAATAGFLVWNWPPARIFMGDVGSGLLGYLLGVFALLGEATASVPLVVWLVLLGAFVFDATVTLARRMLRGEQWYKPHRRHAYQRAVQAGWTHKQVTTAVLLLNLLLAGLAVAAWIRPALVAHVIVVAAVVLLAVYRFVELRQPMGPAEPFEETRQPPAVAGAGPAMAGGAPSSGNGRSPWIPESSHSHRRRMRLKILHVVGARPNFMKVAPLVPVLGECGVDQLLVHTGQHYDDRLSAAFFRDLDIPAADVNLGVGSASHAVQTAEIMKAFEPILLEHRPDLVSVYGDVNSTVACALVAAKLGVAVAHVEAGLRSGDRTMPEEINRVLTDQLAELLLTPSRDADDNLRAEGVPEYRISFVGNIMIDTVLAQLERAREMDVLRSWGLERGEYSLVTLHRPANVDHPTVMAEVFAALAELARERPVLFPMHPRTRKNAERFGLTPTLDRVRVCEPLRYHEMLGLMEAAALVLTDSGGIQEETTALGTPCLTLRDSTERPVTLTEGTNTLVPERTCEAILVAAAASYARRGRVPENWDGQTARRITDVLEAWWESTQVASDARFSAREALTYGAAASGAG